MNTDAVQTFTFYDLETFGTDTIHDRIVQFAAIRTDANFNPIEKTVLYCKPPKDYLPNVEAILLTGITPSYANAHGLQENQFILEVLNFLTKQNNCVLGFNSIKFDDEFLRHTAYRNFYPAYKFNTTAGSSRWDILPLIRLCAALCPEGINFPILEEENRINFKLEELTVANNLSHEHAHDALSDVEATIALTRLIKERQPKMFDYVFNHRSKASLFELLCDPHSGNLLQRPMVAINSYFGPEHIYAGVILPICFDKFKSSIYCWDLSTPKENYKDLPSAEELDCSAVKLQDLGIIKIKLTACPIIVPYSVLNKKGRPERIDINLQQVDENLSFLRDQKLFENLLKSYVDKYTQYYNQVYSAKKDPDSCLYSLNYANSNEKFQDGHTMDNLHAMENTNPEIFTQTKFFNETLNKLLFLYKARNFEHLLNDDEKLKWNQRLREYGNDHGVDFKQALSDNYTLNEKDQNKVNILKEIATYYGITG